MPSMAAKPATSHPAMTPRPATYQATANNKEERMKRLRRVKIVATLGPASGSEKVIEELARAGADVFRINMSHASHDLMRETVQKIRNVEKTLSHPLGILVDLQGPKLRVGKFADGAIQLVAGQKFTLDSSETPGTRERVNLPHPEIIES